jgi:hypothetical protein
VTTPRTESVIILGATLTSLVASFGLATRGYRITILEHPRWHDDDSLSPYLLGCHRNTWQLLDTLSLITPNLLSRTTPLEFRLPDGRIVAYRATSLPGSLHWIAGLVRFRGLAWNDRWQLLSYLERVWEQEVSVPTRLDTRTAGGWLTSIGQSPKACAAVWEPLARFLTGNRLAELSAATFIQSLLAPFLTDAKGSYCTWIDEDTHTLLLRELHTRLTNLGVVRLPQSEIPSLHFDRQRVSHLRLADGSSLQASWYLSGIPRQALLGLLPDRALTRYSYFAHMSDLTELPEIRVRMCDRASQPHARVILCSGNTFDSISCSTNAGGETVYELSAAGATSLLELGDVRVAELAQEDMRVCRLAADTQSLRLLNITRHPYAALSMTAGTALLRPIQRSPIDNLLVAGPWTDTGWPPSLEGSVVSAQRCVDLIAGVVA